MTLPFAHTRLPEQERAASEKYGRGNVALVEPSGRRSIGAVTAIRGIGVDYSSLLEMFFRVASRHPTETALAASYAHNTAMPP